MNRELVVPIGVAAKRLDVFLAETLKLSRSQVQRWFKHDQVTVNGSPVRANYVPQAGDLLTIRVPEKPAASWPAPKLPIVYEDDDLIVIDKPPGIAVHAGNGRSDEPTVADFARVHTTDPDPERPGIVHRLDRDTSGLLVIAKTPHVKQLLQDQWRSRTVTKTYRLLAVGRVEPGEAVIDLPLGRDPAHPTKRHVSSTGRIAVTRYTTLASYPGYSYIEAYPETGRTHQIRVHFAALGHAVAGDVVYGPNHRPLGLKRQFLHATRLVFTAPSGRQLDLQSSLPLDLETVLTALEEPYT